MFGKIKQSLKQLLYLRADAHHIALSFAVGLFITITPFYGIHIWFVLLICYLFHLNVPACTAGSLLNVPVVAPLVYGTAYVIGHGVTGWGIDLRQIKLLVTRLVQRQYPLLPQPPDSHMVAATFLSLFLGTLVLGALLSLPAYFIVYNAIKRTRLFQSNEPNKTVT